MQKQFIAIKNEKRGLIRFDDYAENLNISQNVLNSAKIILQENFKLNHVDYEKINKRLVELCAYSEKWLDDALKLEPKLKTLSEFDITHMEAAEIKYDKRTAYLILRRLPKNALSYVWFKLKNKFKHKIQRLFKKFRMK